MSENNLTPIDEWSDVPQLEITDKVLGGAGQIANAQAQALANRSLNLKNIVESNKTTQDNKNLSIDSAIENLNSNKVNISDIVNNSTTTASGKVLDGRMGKTLNDAITSNYNTLNTNKINKSDIVTNYTTNNNSKVLAASVAVSLKTLIDGKQASGSYVLTSNVVNNVTTTASGKVLDGRVGKTLNDTITSNYNTLNTNKINKSDIVTNYTTNNTSKVASASVAYALKGLIDTKVNTADIVNNTTTTASGKVLDGRVGKTLADSIASNVSNLNTAINNRVLKSDIVNNTTTTASGKVLDGRVGKTLNDLITTANTNITNLNNNKVNKSDIVTNYTTNNTSKVASASVAYALKGLIDTANTNITNLSNNKVNKSDIINNLTSTATDKPLSANQGKILNEKIVSSVPIGTILPYLGSTSTPPTGFLWCNGATNLSKTTYANLFAVLGEAFSVSATTFRIPDLRQRFLEGHFAIGNNGALMGKYEAGLPDITASGIPSWDGQTPSGAFYATESSYSRYPKSGGGGSATYFRGGAFSASRSNAIYGASIRVQPASQLVNFIIKY